MTIHCNRAGKPTVKFYFAEPIEGLRKDTKDDLTATIEPEGEEYRVRVYEGDCRTHDFTFKRERKLLTV